MMFSRCFFVGKVLTSALEKNLTILYEVEAMNIKFYMTFLALLALQSPAFSVTPSPEMLKMENEQKLKEFNSIIQYYEGEIKKDPKNLRLTLAVAEVYYSLKNYPLAVEYYKKALALDPENQKIKTSLAKAYLNNNDLVNSYELFENINQLDPKNIEVLSGLGRIEALKHHVSEAESYYQKVLALDPTHFTTLFYLGELRIEQGQYGEAQEILEKLEVEDPKATWVTQALKRAKQGPILQEIKLIEEKGNYKEAIDRYKQLYADDPESLDLYIAVGRIYTEMKRYKDAIALYKHGLSLYPDANQLRIALGFTYLAKNDLTRSKNTLEVAAKRSPLDPEVWAGLGRIAALEGDEEDAEKLYQRSLKLNPSDTLTLSYLANLRMEQKKFKEAGELFKKIYQINPKAIWAKQAVEEAKLAPLVDAIHRKEEQKHYKEAEKLYKELLAASPEDIDNYIRFANFYTSQKLYRKAVEVYLRGLEINKGSPRLQVALGYAYLANGDLAKGQKVFKKILEEDPPNADALAGLGRIEALMGEAMEAEAYYQWALGVDPTNTTALSYLADLYMQDKKYEEAMAVFEKIQKVAPDQTWAKQSLLRAQLAPSLEQIKALEESGDIKGAILKYQQLLAAAPDDMDIYIELGRLYIALNRYKEAIQLFQNGLQHDPTANQLRVRLGLAYIGVNNLTTAKKLLETSFIHDPKNTEAIAGLGRIAALTGDTKTAGHFYQAALDLNPTDLLTLSYYAQFLLEQKKFAQAQKLFEKILKLDPKETWVLQSIENAKHGPLLEEIYKKEEGKDFDDAETLYRQLIAEAPDNADYYVKFGQYLVRMKRYQEAVILYLQGLSVQPDSSQLQVALGFAYIGKGDLAIAKSVFETVLKREPANAEALSGLGKIAELQGNIKDAESLYEMALKAQPSNLTALIYLAELKVSEGDYEASQRLFKRILRLDPTAEWVKLALEDAKHGRLIAEIKAKQQAKDDKGAEILYQQLLLEAPNVAAYYLRTGLFFHHIKQYQKAIDVYNRGIKIAPNDADLYAALGLVYLSKKNIAEARKAFLSALKIDPRNADSLAGLGSVAILNNKLPRANKYILQSLAVDPNNVVALSSLGNLRMIEKNYSEAEKAYARLMELQPGEKWVKLLYENAKNGPELDQIKILIDDEKLGEAATRYGALIAKYPENPYYYFGQGLMYLRLKQYSNAIETYSKGIESSPEENELLVSLGYAYLFNKNLDQAREVLTKALRKDAKNAEALAGLGRVNALEDNIYEAEDLYRRALAISPINQSAITFYGDLLMKQKRYNEALQVLTVLKQQLPNAEWVQRVIQDAEDGPMTDLARNFSNCEEFETARVLYWQLVDASPEDPSRYQPLGQTYINLHEYDEAICVFHQGLMFDPDALYLWRGIASAYIELADYETARCILMYLLGEDNKDAESWALMGRIEAFHGSPCCAETYYEVALSINPKSMTALSYLSDLKRDQQYNFTGLELYSVLMQIDSDPKWVQVGFRSFLDLTCPTLSVVGAYHQEMQWDSSVHRWSAEYDVYGGSALLNYPINDVLTLWGRCEDQFYVLKDLLTHSNIYSFDVQRLAIGGKWVYSPCFFIETKAGLCDFSPYSNCTNFRLQKGTIAEPALTFTYHHPREKATLNFSGDADLIARDFNTNFAKLVGRYIISGTYEREVFKRGWIGVEGDLYWYRDYVNNTSQRASAWLQWRPPRYTENIMFKYFTKYQGFAKNIPDYYTYKFQVINLLQMTLEKSWRVCWADYLYTSLNYGHGWQDTRTRYPQIIVIDPVSGQPALVWDRRQYDILSANIIYRVDQLQLTLSGDVYRDTEKYTMWSLIAGARWRF